MHQTLGKRSTISLISGDNANVWKDIGLRIDIDTFCTSCQISSMNKKSGSKNALNPKAYCKWVFINIIPEIEPKRLTSDTTFYNDIFIVYAYSKITKLYGVDIITTA